MAPGNIEKRRRFTTARVSSAGRGRTRVGSAANFYVTLFERHLHEGDDELVW
jgi:hypothetical protein